MKTFLARREIEDAVGEWAKGMEPELEDFHGKRGPRSLSQRPAAALIKRPRDQEDTTRSEGIETLGKDSTRRPALGSIEARVDPSRERRRIMEQADWNWTTIRAGIVRVRGTLARVIQPWVDWSTYRPIAALVIIALTGLLAPLVWDFTIALFYTLPAGIRHGIGQSGFCAFLTLGLVRLFRVRRGDRWPGFSAFLQADPVTSRWMPWAVCAGAGLLAVPIMTNPDGLGFADWDFVLDKYEAARRTILEWGQFPWWNPWCRGGFPLAAEPQIGVTSLAMPLVLGLGTTIGLRLAAVLYVMIAAAGAYRLGRFWLHEPYGSAVVALVYALNGGVLVHMAQGFIIPMSYCALPWMVYHAFCLGTRTRHALALGFWTAFMLLTGLQYLTLYTLAVVAVIMLRGIRVIPASARWNLPRQGVLALGLCLALSGWRLGTVGFVIADDQREQITHWDESILSIPHYLLDRPRPDWPTVLPGRHHADYFELNSYVGPVVVLLVLLSLAHGWRWWHTLALFCGWLAIGSIRFYQPSAWLASWPLFGSAHVVTRWRFVAFLGIGLAAGDVVARLRRSKPPLRRRIAVVATALIAVDFLILGFQQLPLAFSLRPGPEWFPGPPVKTIVNVADGLGFPCTARGYGVIRGYEPMLSYRRDAPTLRLGREVPGYRGEAWTTQGPIEPDFWSPNRMIYRVAPSQEVEINQNPGDWWRVNGRPVFADRRCAEPMVHFIAVADQDGRLDLTIEPPGLDLGIELHLLGIALLGAGLLVPRFKARRGSRRF